MRLGSRISFSALMVVAAIAGPRAAQAQAAGPFKVDAMAADRGKRIWNSKQCFGCHELGHQQATGPDLIGVTDRRSVSWLHKWLKDPVEMASDDSVAAALKRQYNSQMPKLGLSDGDAEALINFLAQQTQEKRGK
jgi:cytochrome c2